MARAQNHRRAKDGRIADPFAERRRRFRPVLRALGLDESYAGMNRRAQEAFWGKKFPDPEFRYEAGVPVELRRAMERAAREQTVEVESPDGGKSPVTARDVITVLAGLRACVDATRLAGMPADVVRFLERAKARLGPAWDRHGVDAISTLLRYVEAEAVYAARADGRLFAVSADFVWLANHKMQMTVDTRAAAPERARVVLGGNARPVFRLGRSDAPQGVRWVECPAAAAGLRGGPERWPVYVQSHAFDQLRERMDAPGCEGWMQYSMAVSMEAPNVVRRDRGGDLLVEFRIVDDRAGYLVVTPRDGALVVRTFLLMSMTGTPEGDRLHRRFRLSRDEAAWLRLHRLSSFTHTDLRDDPELRAMLEASGCAGLLKLRRQSDFSPSVTGYAAELRKFVGLGAPAAAASAAVGAEVEGGDPTLEKADHDAAVASESESEPLREAA